MATYTIQISIPDKEERDLFTVWRLLHQPQNKERDLDYLKRIVKVLLINAAHEGFMRQAAQRMTIPGINT